jgi:ABC-2 type transport system permease protein
MSVTELYANRDSANLPDEAIAIAGLGRSENSLRVLIPHTLVQTHRLLLRLARNPMTVLHALIIPVLFLLTLNVVLGDTIRTITGNSALYGNVPMSTLTASMAGSSVGAIGLIRERADGLLARLWVVPVHRASGLLSRILAETVRVVVTVLVIMSAGLLLGLRFHHGWMSTLVWVSIPITFGVAFATLVTTTVLYWSNSPIVEAVSLVVALGIFLCTGFVPLKEYPHWIQPVVHHQPMSYAVEAMRGLALGGPVREPLVAILLWSGGIVGACVVPMVIGYRRASMRG